MSSGISSPDNSSGMDQDFSDQDSPVNLQIKQSPVRSPASPGISIREISAPMILEPRDISQGKPVHLLSF